MRIELTTCASPKENLTVLVAGHRPDRLPGDEAERALVRGLLRAALRGLRDAAHEQNVGVRVVTGTADGCDAWAVQEAHELGIECRVVGANAASAARPARAGAITHVWLGDGSTRTVPEEWFAATDEAKLAAADLLLVVWDGQAPRGFSGGSVRLVIEALRRGQPVIWLDANDARTGRVLLRGPLPTARVALLDADETNVTRLTADFTELLDGRAVAPEDLSEAPDARGREEAVGAFLAARFAGLIRRLTRPRAAEGFDQLVSQWDPEDRKVRAGRFFRRFLSLFGYPGREGGRVLTAWRGPQRFVDGSRLASRTWTRFDEVDRAATHAALSHRDQIVALHVLAALAVVCAVAGAIRLFGGSALWALAEFAVLVRIVWLVVREKRRKVPVHRAWLLLRQAAEALRLQALLRPFLASLPALERSHWRGEPGRTHPPDDRSGEGDRTEEDDRAVGHGMQLVSPQTWWASRSVRDTGPLANTAEGDYVVQSRFDELVGTLRSLIEDQRDYHARTHERWHRLHHGLERAMLWIFVLVSATVLSHLFALGVQFLENHGQALPHALTGVAHWLHEQRWLLLITAAGPAFAACLHGIGGKLEIRHVAEQSGAMRHRLDDYREALDQLERQGGDDRFMALRALAIQVASAMYAEHETWFTLLRGNEVEIPA